MNVSVGETPSNRENTLSPAGDDAILEAKKKSHQPTGDDAILLMKKIQVVKFIL